MPKPLRLQIRPPFAGTPDQTWTLVHGYGPETAPGSTFHPLATFRTPGAGTVLAAGDGVLTTTPPGWWPVDPRDSLQQEEAPDPLLDRVTLYLNLSPRVASGSTFHARSRELGFLQGFAYFDMERSSLESVLGPLLDGLGVGGAIDRTLAIESLVRGELTIPVSAGDAIARAAPSTSTGAPAGAREFGFAAVLGPGLTDPSFVYDWMRDFVEDSQPDVDAFLALSPIRWPIIDPQLPVADGIALTSTATFAWPVLVEFRTSRNLTRSQWRTIGDNQKRLYRERLLARAGRAPAASTEPPFEFNDRDADNLFQLEAIVEFYANFDDPWLPAAAPRNPGAPGYVRVDLLDPAGAAATAANRTVTLDGDPDLSRVRRNDLIVLDADTARATRTYRISAINGATLTLDAAPAVAGTTAWRINVRPTIAIIDPFGPRERSGAWLRGASATVTSRGVVHLDGTAGLGRLNHRRAAPAAAPAGNWLSGPFDTIYLPSDRATTAPGRPARTYRILSADPAARTVTVDGVPDFGGGTSSWHVPAGVSGELPPLQYDIGPHRPENNVISSKGTDHYDGVAFVIDAGEVKGKTRTSSYTSRREPAGDQGLSSVRGNRRYNVRSFRSTGDFKNYCLRVEDFGAIPPGGGEASAGNDTVADARFYFEERVTADANGKALIRLHRGTRNGSGSGSLGCLVSPVFVRLRDFIVARHLQDFAEANPGMPLPRYSVLLNASNEQSAAIYNNTDAPVPNPLIPVLRPVDWNDLLVATLWLIRPDERPLG